MNRNIYLYRHGKTIGNKEKRYIGITDEPLSEEGIAEIKNNEYVNADMVFTSPLKRAIQTAKIIYPQIRPIVIENIRETDFGEFEGKNYMELQNNPKYQAWIDSNGEASFPGGENPAEVKKRAIYGFHQIIELSENAENIVIITHGGIIMSILKELFGGDFYNYHVENGKGYSFEISSDGLYSGLCAR